MVIDDGDGPHDLGQEQDCLPLDVLSDPVKSPDAQPVALAPGLGLLSRSPSQLFEGPGIARAWDRVGGGAGLQAGRVCDMLVASLAFASIPDELGLFPAPPL